ncbi:hypothetical protein [Sphingobium aromaticiconvertens]|uniref:hypothetical protein n=1 Tax=Sphingobium aromaticiconvertens TaxID=365341 RepID=UPI0030194AB3
MIPAPILPLIRRAILDLLNDIGGEQNDDYLVVLLSDLGHRIARRDIATQMDWLAGERLIEVEELGPYKVGRILSDGRDIAEGRLVVEGVWRHKTGD